MANVVLWLAGGSLGAFLLAVFLVFLFCAVRSMCCFRRLRGKQPAQVFHSAPMELYCSSNAFDSQRVHCTLWEKGISCKVHDLDTSMAATGFQNLTDEALQMNPNGTLPFLVHGGHPVLGNLREILEYADHGLEGVKMIPQKENAVAEMAQVINLCLKDLSPSVAMLSFPVTAQLRTWRDYLRAFRMLRRWPNPLPEFTRLLSTVWKFGFSHQLEKPDAISALRRCSAVLAALDQKLGDGRAWFVGDFSLADVIVAADLNRLEVLGLLDLIGGREGGCPNVMAYWKRMQARPSFGPCFRPNADTPGKQEVERAVARFRKELLEGGLEHAYRLEEEEEEDGS